MQSIQFFSATRKLKLSVAIVLFVFAVLHCGLVLYDLSSPESFLHADRATARLATITNYTTALDEGRALRFLSRNGNPGDYLPHAFLLMVGGPILVIFVQVALTILSGFWVGRIAAFSGLPQHILPAVVATYLVLPHSLVLPHQLATEPIFTPLLLASVYILICRGKVRPLSAGLLSGLLLGLATLVRPVTLIWPPILAALIWMQERDRAIGFLVGSYLILAFWMLFVFVQTDQISMSSSSRDAGRNLYNRVDRIAQTMETEAAKQVRFEYLSSSTRRLSPIDYVAFVLDYPMASAQHHTIDTLVFLGKSGIERITVDYIPLNPNVRESVQNKESGWRVLLEREGIFKMVETLYANQGVALVVSLLGTIAMVSLVSLALVGAFWSNRSQPVASRSTTVLLTALVIYITVVSQAVNAAQSRHRAPAEGALVILAFVGGQKIRHRIKAAKEVC